MSAVVYLRVGPFGVFLILALVAVALLFAGVGSGPVSPLDNRLAPGGPVLRGQAGIRGEAAAPENSPGRASALGQSSPPLPRTHTVKPGETVWRIAKLYRVTGATLAAANNLADPNSISPGQVLTIPSEGEIFYEVKPGETLWQIATRFGAGADEIANLNNIGESSILAVGQKLRLPVARSDDPDPEASGQKVKSVTVSEFHWPLRGRITSGFGLRWGRQHTGIDIAGVSGDPVRASKAGVVTVAGWMGGYGKAVVLQHGDGTATLYGHNSGILVSKGQAVKQGEQIAAVGSTGNSTGPHLHFEIILGKNPVDPLPYLNAR